MQLSLKAVCVDLLLILFSACNKRVADGAPLQREASAFYHHWQGRQAIIDTIITSSSRRAARNDDEFIMTLSKEEKALDRYLCYLRERELSRDQLARSIEQNLGDILQSDLFQVLRNMPKGGNMHVHENHLLSRRLLLDLIWDCPDFKHLYILPEEHPTRALEMDFFLHVPQDEPWTQVKDHQYYTKDHLVRKLNYVDILLDTTPPSAFDTRRRWRDTWLLWSSISKVIANAKVKVKYIEAVLKSSLEDGVQYLETKKSFGEKERLYQLDPDPKYEPTQGKKYLEVIAGTQEIPLVNSIIRTMRGNRTDTGVDIKLIAMKRLVQSVRHFPQGRVLEDVQRAIQLHRMYPEMIAGFDLAGEEDTGHSSLYHANSLLLAAEYSKDTNNSFSLVCHAGETSYSGEVIYRPSDDPDAFSASNVADSMALNASRIGHGLTIFKYPDLVNSIRDRDIAIEVCPVCNQMLGYVPDARNHPALTYHRSGIPIVLGSDAHGVLGSNYFSVDWYLAYTAWNIGLVDLKQFARQSLAYSAMAHEEKVTALATWSKAWDNYTIRMYKHICGDSVLTVEEESNIIAGDRLQISRVIPQEIPSSVLDDDHGTHIDFDIYGDDFSSLICGDIYCRTGRGDREVVTYLSAKHLVCRIRVADIYDPKAMKDQPSSFNITLEFDQALHGTAINQTVQVV